MKKSTILIILVGLGFPLMSQLKVDNLGHVGIGTSAPNTAHVCDIRGDMLLSNYPASPASFISFRLGLQAYPHNNIYCSQGGIVFGDIASLTFMDIGAGNYATLSDRRFKENISELENGLDKVLKLKTYQYTMARKNIKSSDSDEVVLKDKRKYGFMADEIEKELSEVDIVTEMSGVKMVEYDMVIPLLVSAVQQQQNLIQSLENRLAVIEGRATSANFQLEGNLQESKPILFQNAPNPFDENTTIRYFLGLDIDASNSQNSISVFNMSGNLIKTYNISDNEGNVLIKGNELEPGMYLYTLIINDEIIDTKTMILEQH